MGRGRDTVGMITLVVGAKPAISGAVHVPRLSCECECCAELRESNHCLGASDPLNSLH